VAAAVVLVAGTVAIVRPTDQTGDLDDLAQAALEAPGNHVITLTSEDGDRAARLVVDGHDGYLLVDDLATLPSGQEYQLWKLGGPAPVSLGMVGDGDDSVASVGVPAGTQQVALSTEPAAGSVAPTGPIVATGQAA
jgi:anti-sigma-K factor RskA